LAIPWTIWRWKSRKTTSGGSAPRIAMRMLAAAARRVVVAGAVAVGAIERAQVCAIDDVDVVVTSAAADADAVQALRDSGVEVVVA
jgi:DeoR/GlpR family transcriptional regulator of sugar metabolism